MGLKIKTEYKFLIGAGVVLIAFFLYQYSGLFVITANDLPFILNVTVNPGDTFEQFTDFGIAGNNVTFKVSTIQKSYPSGKIFFMLDNASDIYDDFPTMTDGTHTINKYQMFLTNSLSQVEIQKWSKTYDLIVNTIYINRTIANQTFYIPGNTTTIYQNQTVYINQTVDKIVTVQPSITDWLNAYKIYIIGIGGVGLVYYLTRRKR